MMKKLEKVVYSLQEAADLLHQPNEHLLQKGIEGKVQLYTPLPEQLALFSVDYQDLFSNKSRSIQSVMNPPSLPVRVARAQLLELHSTTCTGLLNNGVSWQSEFERAVTIHGDGRIEAVSAQPPHTLGCDYLLDEPRNSFRWLFACYARDFQPDRENRNRLACPHVVEVTPSVTYITRATLLSLSQNSAALVPNFEVDLSLIIAPHISKRLVGLRQLLLDLWNSRANGADALPSAEAIALELTSNYGFTKNHAQQGARLIKKSSIELDRLTAKKKLVAPYINALIECSDLHWENIVSPDYYPKNSEMVSWLESVHGFPTYLAEAGVGIIRPDSAALGGRPRRQ